MGHEMYLASDRGIVSAYYGLSKCTEESSIDEGFVALVVEVLFGLVFFFIAFISGFFLPNQVLD